jgi:hydroxyacylglutathione hydrolase
MTTLEIHQFICGEDNFGLLAHDPASELTASVDAPDSDTIVQELRKKDWTLTHILTTHHHRDHTAGHEELKHATGCMIVGAKRDIRRIPGIDMAVEDGAQFQFGKHTIRVIETPGHTLGHICYWVPDASVVFTGDTLFSLGCGRLFEGDAAMMWQSLQKLMALPKETLVYCGHEYTVAGSGFAVAVEPGNAALQMRVREAKGLRERGAFTLPSSIAAETEQNPFLRPDSVEIQANLGLLGASLDEVFAALRRAKDRF